MKFSCLALMATVLIACQAEPEAVADASSVGSQSQPSEPVAVKKPHVLEAHGEQRVDNYYWLRDDTRSDPEVLAYLEAENAWTDYELRGTRALQQTLYDEMVSRLTPEDASVPVRDGDYWYYFRFQPDQDFAIHARRAGSLEAAEEILIDGNERADGHDYYSLANLTPSDDGRFIAIAEDFIGRRIHEIRILDTDSGEFLPDVLTEAARDLAWSADGQYLFYLKRDPQTLLAKYVMRHKLGAAPAEDQLVYEERDETFYTSLYRSRSGVWVALMHSETNTTEVQLMRADNPTGAFKPVIPRENNHEYSVEDVDGTLYILTNWQAKNFRVIATDHESAVDKSKWTEVIPTTPGLLITDITALRDWVVLETLQDGHRRIWAQRRLSEERFSIDTNEPATTYWGSDNISTDSSIFRYVQTSLTKPNQTWEVDLDTGTRQLLKETKVPGAYDATQYAAKKIDVPARDGTLVPVTLAYHRNTPLDGSAPGLVYGYGSYGSSNLPYFNPALISLLDRGFVYAIAHIRGGQERGREWYEDGKMMNKINTFTDFVDVTDALQKEAIVDPKRTYARGGSAGGLLMGAVLNMAPDLYHGVIAAVPFVDVITTMSDPSIPLTTGEWNEWGDPREKAAYDYMLSYSPYDQVSVQDYPNLLVTTGLHDSQVQYFEPAKWVAKLREYRTDQNKLVLYTDMSAGHSGASGRLKRLDDYAREFAFLVSLSEGQDAPN